MPALRDRPWTEWFLILTLSFNVILMEFGPAAFIDIAIGQSIVVGVWASLDSAHRLIRAIVFLLAAIFLSHLLNVISPGRIDVNLSLYLTVAIAIQATAAIAAATTLATQTWIAGRILHKDVPHERPQLRLIELLVWMGLVAIASIPFRVSPNLQSLNYSSVFELLVVCLVSGFCCSVLMGRNRPPRQLGIPLTIGVVAVSLWVSRHSSDLQLYFTIYAYVGCYIACCLVDDGKRTTSVVE